ncbi:cell division protein FtsL [Gracilibacillus marinus]|jgi:cell division protein FtsL|uniref:Cell division protein FtsL n=1 Tax=Gracilibacillus marinus TaxID=630535 RepID=A0ABV8VS68_9BACI
MSANQARNLYTNEEMYQSPQKRNKVVKKQVVKRNSWITRGEKLMYSIFATMLIVVCAYLVYFNSSLDQINRETQKLDTQIAQQETKIKNYTYEKKELSQPERIINFAKEHGLELKNSKVKQASEVIN